MLQRSLPHNLVMEAIAPPLHVTNGGRPHDWPLSGTDSAPRAVAIATGLDYVTVWNELYELCQHVTQRPNCRRTDHPETFVDKDILAAYLAGLGWRWRATQRVGACEKVLLSRRLLPDQGTYICRISKGWVCLKDGVLHDVTDPSRDGTRLVYGWFERGPHVEGR